MNEAYTWKEWSFQTVKSVSSSAFKRLSPLVKIVLTGCRVVATSIICSLAIWWFLGAGPYILSGGIHPGVDGFDFWWGLYMFSIVLILGIGFKD